MKTLLTALAFALGATAALAQAFPSKPVKLVVPFSAGSGTDIAARTVGEFMARGLGQPVVVENKPGAGGTIAAAQVAKGEADGHTVLVPSSGHAVNPSIYPTLSYDTLKDLTGVTPLVAVHVPFKGTPEAISDIIGGRSDWFFAPVSSALPLIRDGKLQALAGLAGAMLVPAAAACNSGDDRALVIRGERRAAASNPA